MANKHLSRKPVKIDPETWYYEERHGIEIIHVQPNERKYAEEIKVTKHFVISWRKLRGAIACKDRKI